MKTSVLTSSLLIVALWSVFGSTPAAAQHDNTPRIDQAQQEIRERIDHGIATGRLAPHEARELYERERELRRMEFAMKRDGTMLPEERRQLRYALDDLNDMVERKLSHRGPPMQGGLHAPGIERGKEALRERIADGMQSGRISRREAQRLHERERYLARQEAVAREDGHLTLEERRWLRSEIAALGNEVERMMDDDRQRHAW